MLNPKIFRERDICGIADAQLPDEDIEVLGKALSTYLIRYSGRTICVGRDTRPSSPRLHSALLKGVISAGAHVLDVGIVPTPVLFYSAYHFSADAAIMITGGNEPLDINGFKVVCGTSLLFGHALEDINKVMQMADFEVGEGSVKEADALTPYVEELASQFHFSAAVNFAVDPDSGITRPLLEQILEPLNASAVKKSEAAFCVSISVDADRLAAVDEKGNPVPSDTLLLLFGREILTRKPNSALLCDEQFPEAIFQKLNRFGGRPIAISPSEPSLQARIKQEHAELSVLASGQIVFADRYYGFPDAIYATCRLLEIVALSEGPLSAEVARLLADHPRPAA
ncbi:MAG: phosphomannomutase [Bryobacterales bacterium]|jgi:phosphomannomutase/phosphoglucomutase|nr:phosphomannomutase [Bryobacterales bacterium]